jgi:hypothetical protein
MKKRQRKKTGRLYQYRDKSDERLNYRSLSLQAEKPESLNEEERSVAVIAATENPVEVFDFERWEIVPEILLMSGCQLPKSRQIPLLDTHQKFSTGDVIGSCRKLQVDNNELGGRAFFSSVEKADDSWIKTREGHLTDYSIGYRVFESVWVPEGESAVIQGRKFNGPVKIAKRWKPRELSVCPVGADDMAKARAEENHNIINKNEEENKMNERLRKFLESRGLAKDAAEDQAWEYLAKLKLPENTGRSDPPATDPPNKLPDENQIREEAVRAEQERYVEITAMGERFDCGELAQSLVKGGKTIEEARQAVLEHVRKTKYLSTENGAGHRTPIEVGTDERDKFRSAAQDALSIRGGFKIEKPASGAEDLTGHSMVELARHALRIANRPTGGNSMEMMGRALTTSDFPLILADVAHKALFIGFNEAEETWPEWCGVGSVSDFKTHNSLRASELDDLDEIGQEEEYKYGKRSEAREQYQVVTFGKLFAISRQSLINDDLNALSNVPKGHGESAARKVGDVVYAVITANSAMGDNIALFHADHVNLASSGGAPAIITIGAAVQAMKLQKDIGGKRRLNIRPKFFIAPVAHETSGEQLFKSQLEGLQAKPNLINPYSGSYFIRVYEPRLDDDSSSAWYIAADKGKTVIVYFLNGVQKPYLETKQGWSVDGVEYKVRIDAGAKAMDWRGMYKNPGA